MDEVKRGYFRGDIWYSNLEQYDIEGHFVVILSNWKNNIKSNYVNVLLITSQLKKDQDTHVVLEGYGLKKKSKVLAEKVFTIPKNKLINKIGHIDNVKMLEIDNAVKNQLQLDHKYNNLESVDLEKLFINNNQKIQDTKIMLEKMKNELYFKSNNGNFNEALLLCYRLKELAEKSKNGDKNNYLWYSLYVKANIGLKLKNYEEALQDAQESICYVELQSCNHSLTLWLIARIQEELGHIDKSVVLYKVLIKYYKNNYDSFMRVSCLFNLAKMLKDVKAMIKIKHILEKMKCNNINMFNTEESKQRILVEMEHDIGEFM